MRKTCRSLVKHPERRHQGTPPAPLQVRPAAACGTAPRAPPSSALGALSNDYVNLVSTVAAQLPAEDA
jgi:hypothetical protein